MRLKAAKLSKTHEESKKKKRITEKVSNECMKKAKAKNNKRTDINEPNTKRLLLMYNERQLIIVSGTHTYKVEQCCVLFRKKCRTADT